MAALRKWGHRLSREKKEPSSDLSSPERSTQREVAQFFAEDHNAVSLALYGELLQRPGNLCFSPFSIRTALAMTFAGARGETAAQIGKALRFQGPDEALHLAFATILRRVRLAGRECEIAVANSLWGQDGEPLEPDFLDLIARHYGGEMNRVDFRHDAEAASVAINRWVEDKTKQRIQDLVSPDALDADTRLVLANAVYFKGTWELVFDESTTKDQPFYLDDGGTVEAPLMFQNAEIPYFQGPGFQAVDLAYEGGDLSMLVLLPDKKDGLRALERQLTAPMLRDCVAVMSERSVLLLLPKFKMTWGSEDLGSPLRALGMVLPFTHLMADFSGINGLEPPHPDSLFISSVVHKAFVEVNEEGTEAAAATAMQLMCGIPDRLELVPPEFRADHPFLFAIRERRTGTLLFLGRVADPTREI